MTVTVLAAEVLAPFYYHGRYAVDGSATEPSVITDTALVFALRAVFLAPSPLLRSKPDYAADLSNIPWRASLLMGAGNYLLPPLRRTVDMEREGGRSTRMQKNMSSGFYKNQFFTHSVQAGARYYGLLVGPDPFALAESDEIIIRIGVSRSGIVRLHRATEDERTVCLNAATACLFNRRLVEDYRILDTIRPTQPYPIDAAAEELTRWLPNPV